MEPETVEGMWACTERGEVYPLHDVRSHDVNDDGECWCQPSWEPTQTSGFWVHHSGDGREKYETGERRPH